MSRAFLEYLAPWLLDHPDEVEITEAEGERGALVLEMHVHPDDMGKIIGRRGRIIRSIRTLARAANRDGGAVMVEVVD
ncbi:MAG TPA: KH domain-containing protein [Actinomycetota bacterium]|nr:KH domain-containing protein [Actinomycetota bacterium]